MRGVNNKNFANTKQAKEIYFYKKIPEDYPSWN
jgi:hypothetical protein